LNGASLSPAESALRFARLVQMAFLAATVLYGVVLFQLPQSLKPMPPLLVPVFVLVAASTVGAGVLLRSILVSASAEKLSADSQNPAALARWRTGIIASFSCAESVALLGFVLRFLGADWNIVCLFFVVTILLLLAWTPRLGLPSSN
jgi:F0F1-type ATP synthase membrane subunit c/vacuolar-type H+-ATPase subunit K